MPNSSRILLSSASGINMRARWKVEVNLDPKIQCIHRLTLEKPVPVPHTKGLLRTIAFPRSNPRAICLYTVPDTPDKYFSYGQKSFLWIYVKPNRDTYDNVFPPGLSSWKTLRIRTSRLNNLLFSCIDPSSPLSWINFNELGPKCIPFSTIL